MYGKLLVFHRFGLTGTRRVDTLFHTKVPIGMRMECEPPSEITQLLQDWRDGDGKALDILLPLVYKELRRLARHQLRNERPDHSLQSAALVHEAYIRLVGVSPPRWESRTHFFAIAAQLMRQILVDYARRHTAAKRGGTMCRLSLEDVMATTRQAQVDVVALDEALQALAKIDERQSRIVELRFFAGLSLNEISEVLEIAPATVQRDWIAARAWLHREISREHRV
jgi:RNA polymerase sigma factor (TIGR02999 family)